MFELIKKWFKRPIVINFTVEPLSSDVAINILKTDIHLTPEIAEAVRKAWTHSSKAFVLGSGITLEQLSDADLYAIGLIRADFSGVATAGVESIPKEGTWLLDKGERVVTQSINGEISRLLNKDKRLSNR